MVAVGGGSGVPDCDLRGAFLDGLPGLFIWSVDEEGARLCPRYSVAAIKFQDLSNFCG